MLKHKIYKSIETKVHFFNISKSQVEIFSWKSEFTTKSHIFDIKSITSKNINKKGVFFHINKGDRKIVYIKTENSFIFCFGADSKIQFQVLEALVDFLIVRFNELYVDILDTFTAGSGHLFQEFNKEVEETIKDFHKLNLIAYVNIFCSVCKATHTLAVKKTLIQNPRKNIIPLVYYHEGITLLVYLDQDFQVRGLEIVSITG